MCAVRWKTFEQLLDSGKIRSAISQQMLRFLDKQDTISYVIFNKFEFILNFRGSGAICLRCSVETYTAFLAVKKQNCENG